MEEYVALIGYHWIFGHSLALLGNSIHEKDFLCG